MTTYKMYTILKKEKPYSNKPKHVDDHDFFFLFRWRVRKTKTEFKEWKWVEKKQYF